MEEEMSSAEVTTLVQMLKDRFKPEPDTRTPIEKGNDEIRGSRNMSAKKRYETLSAHVAALKKNQNELERATKVSNSPLLRTYESLKSKMLGLPGDGYSATTIDQITQKHFDISSQLAGSLKDAKRDAEYNLAAITAYKENVFKKYSDALEIRKTSETELDNITKLHRQSVSALNSIKKKDQEYITLAKGEKMLKRTIQQELTSIAKANQQIAFADAALKSLATVEDQAILYVVRLDQVENFAANSLEYARNKKRFYDVTAGGDDVLMASQTLCESLSKTLAMQAKQIDMDMQKNRGKSSKVQYKMLIPDTMLSDKLDYASDMYDSTRTMNLGLENRVQSIMNERGYSQT